MARQEIQYAGEFRLLLCQLVTVTGNTFDISELVEQIDIYEDIYKATISGSILIKDTTNLVYNLPILGEERLLLYIETPQSNPTPETTIDYRENPLMIYKINMKEKGNESSELISLQFGSIEGLRNSSCRVSQSYKGKPSEIVEKIIRDETYLKSAKKIHKEETANLIKIIFPNKRPFDCIQHLTNISNSQNHGDSPTYLFYETTKGFHYVTFDGLSSMSPKMYYREHTPMVNETGAFDVQTTMESILRYQLISSKDTIKNIYSGMLSSKLIAHDVYNKKINTHKFDYLSNFKNDTYPDGNESFPIVSLSKDPETNLMLTEHEDTRMFVSSTSGGYAFSDKIEGGDDIYPYQSDNLEKTLQRKTSRLLQMTGGVVLNVEINGNTSMQVGDKIHLTIESNSTLTGDAKDTNLDLTGNYIITRLKHKFVRTGILKHTIVMQVTKFNTRREYPAGGISNVGKGVEQPASPNVHLPLVDF